MRVMLKSFAVAVLFMSGLAGCGGALEPESGDALVATEQELRPCLYDGTMAGSCPSTETCVGGTCRPKCDFVSEEALSSCASGQKCCPGYVYSDGSTMYPYCISTYSTCYTPRG